MAIEMVAQIEEGQFAFRPALSQALPKWLLLSSAVLSVHAQKPTGKDIVLSGIGR